jgi:hypothetical protein
MSSFTFSLYKPESQTDLPVVLCFSNPYTFDKKLCEVFSNNGFLCLSCVSNFYPSDYSSLLLRCQKQLSKYKNVDVVKFIVVGNGDFPGYAATSLNVFEKRVSGCVSINGIYTDKNLSLNVLKNMFGTRNVYYDVFPIYNVCETTTPVMLVSDLLSTESLHRQTLDFHFALKQSGVYVETYYYRSSDLLFNTNVRNKILSFINNISD